jgi:hypothetical protein
VIFVLECPEGAPPRAWFAFDADDLRSKLAARGGPPDCAMQLWPDEAGALRAFENDAEPAWQGSGWKARLALREQLVATEVLAEG